MQKKKKVNQSREKNVLWYLFRILVEKEKVPPKLSERVESKLIGYIEESKPVTKEKQNSKMKRNI